MSKSVPVDRHPQMFAGGVQLSLPESPGESLVKDRSAINDVCSLDKCLARLHPPIPHHTVFFLSLGEGISQDWHKIFPLNFFFWGGGGAQEDCA